ncbi:MAG TPA: hypothetical protein ENK38_01325 [Gammaproteobacteria bacterium]|nr:hypothetical protein [Gammaproteobacteria bacterium]
MGSKVRKSPGERAAADLAEKQYTDYRERFIPLETAFEGQLDRIRDDRTRATGSAATDAVQAYDPVIQQTNQLQMANGVDPNSGRAVMTSADMATGRAGGMAGSAVNADQSTEDRYYAGQNELIRIGQGQANSATQGFMSTARMDANTARSDAIANSIRENAKWNMAGTAVGLGSRYALQKFDTPGRRSGAGVMGASKPWNDITSGPSTIRR